MPKVKGKNNVFSLLKKEEVRVISAAFFLLHMRKKGAHRPDQNIQRNAGYSRSSVY